MNEIVQAAGAADKLCQEPGCGRRAEIMIVLGSTLRYFYCEPHSTEPEYFDDNTGFAL